MELLEYVSVMDMAKIYSEMATDNHAEKIWNELRSTLQERKEKLERRKAELLLQQQQREAEEERRLQEEKLQQEEEERKLREEEEERARQREARRKRREEELAAEEAAALAEQEAAEEAAALAREEERKRKEEKRRLRREARERELQAQQEALAAEEAERKKRRTQKAAWEEYVANHPLEFCEVKQTIEQKKVQHQARAPPTTNKDILSRIYTPKCPECGMKYSLPPKMWECSNCFRTKQQHVKVWQPDNSTTVCMVCQGSIGWFSRHHCRNCGRLVCSKCSTSQAIIPSVGFNEAVKICDDCARKGNAPNAP
uniref:Uncharacterized protein TCIL3000_9_4140 n=1 Tax=Trypanosoma congolense (strain IL3000) TaxID=1068625 RepID=G0UUF0_TRYCI|nr:unnamed protein product [Trypanosoma congolense IL3000]